MNRQNTAALRLDSPDSPARCLAEKAPRDLLRHDHGGIVDEVRLIGQPPLQKYLRFVRDKVVNGADFDRRVLVREWRRANEYYQGLEESETGIADDIEVLDLDPVLFIASPACCCWTRRRAIWICAGRSGSAPRSTGSA